MVNMTDIFGNALSIAGSFMDSDLVNRFMMVIFAVILVFLDDAGRFSGRRRSCVGGCTYNGNTGEINNADRSTGGRSCVRSDCISDL